ncbi:MAG: hypothetical protein MJ215_04665 [Spirochaetia bacterium]|nr:hypothetical protein [Spirochaetia bacterium]
MKKYFWGTMILLLFFLPLAIFWFIYPAVMNFSQEHILLPVYKSLLSKGTSITFAINMRILIKGFIFTVVLGSLWFPFTLLARQVYLRSYLQCSRKHPY